MTSLLRSWATVAERWGDSHAGALTPAVNEGVMSSLPVILNCEGCGACCRTMNVPPFRIDAGCNEPAQRKVPEPLLDELLIAWEVRLRLPPGPCSWLDETTLRCRHYDLRPQACRDFALGGPACLATRAAAGLCATEPDA